MTHLLCKRDTANSRLHISILSAVSYVCSVVETVRRAPRYACSRSPATQHVDSSRHSEHVRRPAYLRVRAVVCLLREHDFRTASIHCRGGFNGGDGERELGEAPWRRAVAWPFANHLA